MDHISDSFLETNVPLLVLIEAAKSGNEKEVKEYAQVFREHANKLVEVSNLIDATRLPHCSSNRSKGSSPSAEVQRKQLCHASFRSLGQLCDGTANILLDG